MSWRPPEENFAPADGWDEPASDPIKDIRRAIADNRKHAGLGEHKAQKSKKSGGIEMNEKKQQPTAQNMKSGLVVENKATNNCSPELSNCSASWAEDPSGSKCALEIKPAEVIHSVRFRTVSEMIWLKSKKPVKLWLVWGKKDQDFTTGKAWERFVLGKPPGGTEWIVTITFGDNAEFYVYPFGLVVESVK